MTTCSWGGSYGKSIESAALLKWTVGPVDFFGVFGDRRNRGSRANGCVIGCSATTAAGGAEGPQLKILMFDFSSLGSVSEFFRR